MTTGATGQLGLALPVQGELSGTWGDTVNNGITQYTNIAIAATLTLTGDGAVTLANTTGDATASNITSSLTGAGTVTAQFAIVKVTGTLTTTKVVTFGSAGSAPYSKTYLVVNAATGGSVSFTAYGGTGVTIAVGESAYVYYDGTNIVKVSSTVATGVTTFSAGTTGFTPSTATSGAVTLAGTLATTNGGTGLTSFTSGTAIYASSTSALSSGTLPTTGGGTGLTSFTSGGAVYATSTSALTTGTLPTTAGGTALTSFTSGGVVYASSTSALATGSALQFDGTNLGVGVTPSTTNYGKWLFIGSAGNSVLGASNDMNVTANAYYNSNWLYGTSTFASRYQQASGQHQWFTAPSGTAGNAITFTQAMTLDASGNLGVGTTSPGQRLHIQDATQIRGAVGTGNNSIQFWKDSSATFVGAIGCGTPSAGLNNALIFETYTSAVGNWAERARIDSSGNFLVGTTTAAAKLTIASTTNPALTLPNIAEIATISATAATGTINYDATTQSVLYYTTNASGNFTMNVRGNSGLSLNSMMSTGQSLTVAFLCTNGGTAYYQTGFQIDGSSVTPKWQGGTAPSSGNTSSIDVYTYAIIKTGSATFTVLASQTQFK